MHRCLGRQWWTRSGGDISDVKNAPLLRKSVRLASRLKENMFLEIEINRP